MKDIKQNINTNKPYSNEDYEEAKNKGLNLDGWNDYARYFELGEEPDYS